MVILHGVIHRDITLLDTYSSSPHGNAEMSCHADRYIIIYCNVESHAMHTNIAQSTIILRSRARHTDIALSVIRSYAIHTCITLPDMLTTSPLAMHRPRLIHTERMLASGILHRLSST